MPMDHINMPIFADLAARHAKVTFITMLTIRLNSSSDVYDRD